jgi:hypothetical protein
VSEECLHFFAAIDTLIILALGLWMLLLRRDKMLSIAFDLSLRWTSKKAVAFPVSLLDRGASGRFGFFI